MMIGLSHALSDALERAGLSAEDIDAAIARQIAKGEGFRLDPWHRQSQAVSRASGLDFVSIARRNGHLLMWAVSNSPFWAYDESSRYRSLLRIPQELPVSVQTKLIGMPVRSLVSASDLIDSMSIVSFGDEPGWTIAHLDPALVEGRTTV